MEKLILEACLTPKNKKFTPMLPKATIPKEDKDPRFPYVKEEEQDPRYVTRYRSVVGATSYLAAATRPDLAFTVNSLSRHQSAPQEHHWAYVKYLLKFLNKSRTRGLIIDPTDKILRIYADADLVTVPPQTYLVRHGSAQS